MQLFAHELAPAAHINYAPRMSESVLAANIRTLRKHLGMNQEVFADEVGSAQANVSRWEKRGSIPEPAPLSRMAELAGCSVTQFMDAPWQPTAVRKSPPLPTRASTDDDIVEIVGLDLSLSMGPGTLIEEFVEAEPIKIGLRFVQDITRTPSDRLRFVTGIGDSMEPTLRHGDRVLVDINDRQLSRMNGIYWIDHYGAHGIKRLRASGKGKIMVMSDNPNVPDFEVGADELRIEGRIVWFARGL